MSLDRSEFGISMSADVVISAAMVRESLQSEVDKTNDSLQIGMVPDNQTHSKQWTGTPSTSKQFVRRASPLPT